MWSKLSCLRAVSAIRTRMKITGCTQFGCLGVYYFFLAVVVIRYETTATARWALLFLVHAFFGDTITVAVWTGFHVCASWEADERPRHVGGAQYAYAYITLGRPSVEILSINGIRVCSKLTIFQNSWMQGRGTTHAKAGIVR